ncbi:hypothetical protein [Noviherbaspirillum humi]|uniref:hypothetical protein n=1 Tax=Noviherbaspirillum humi TaxID=1688639 RepID=UPI000B77AE2C|nr:hypothetical protein [Noviherbaspirillum humi]
MATLDILLTQLDDVGVINNTRKELIVLIRHIIDEEWDLLTEQQRTHLANAIGSLALNVNAIVQPTNAWLRLCISDLQRVAGQRLSGDTHRDSELDKVTKADLIAAINSVSLKLTDA